MSDFRNFLSAAVFTVSALAVYAIAVEEILGFGLIAQAWLSLKIFLTLLG